MPTGVRIVATDFKPIHWFHCFLFKKILMCAHVCGGACACARGVPQVNSPCLVFHWPGQQASGILLNPTWPVGGGTLEACATAPRCFTFPSWKLEFGVWSLSHLESASSRAPLWSVFFLAAYSDWTLMVINSHGDDTHNSVGPTNHNG